MFDSRCIKSSNPCSVLDITLTKILGYSKPAKPLSNLHSRKLNSLKTDQSIAK